MKLISHLLYFIAIVVLLCRPVLAQKASFDLGSLSMEELMDLEVSLTSRTETKLFETAAAVFVLTGDEIRRAGVTSLPEALRLVPGMQVASIDGNKWAVSARGFTNRFANKLLVLVDGRHIYSPLFAGVFWETVDVVLEDVERIEVVRGPGATLWGANAVNGIVHIVTKNANQTQGLAAAHTYSLTGRDKSWAVRYGGPLAGDGSYRLYGKHFGHDQLVDAEGAKAADEWEMLAGGFRADWEKGQGAFSLQGSAFSNEIEQNLPERFSAGADSLDEGQDAAHTGGHLLAHWQRTLSPRSAIELKGYYDLYERDDGVNDIKSQAYELDFQHRFVPRRQRTLIWGLSYRRTRDETRASFELPFTSPDADSDIFSAFAHGEAVLADGHLRLALGSKFEHNKYTDLEYQPSARLLWTPDIRQALWVSATRAVRTPALSYFRFAPNFPDRPNIPDFSPRDGSSILGPPGNIFASDLPDFQSETVRTLEAGYRLHVTKGLFFDLTAYYNDYANLRLIAFIPPPIHLRPGGFQPGTAPGRPPGLDEIEPVDATTVGGEVVADWQWERGRLRAVYARVDFDLPAGAPQLAGTESEQRFYLWPSLDLRDNVQVDAIFRHVDPLARARVDSVGSEFRSALAGYTDLDLRLAWQLKKQWEISLVGQNLLHDHRPEYTGFVIDSRPSEVRRVIYVSLRRKF
ncbi:MAG: iron complex outermembrane receptor protein [Planctomycetota bacterium]|jgi:iron complex outermembrane receptor protein